MKKIVSIFLCVVLICLSSVTVFAADIDIADEGKTLLTIGDWTYSLISGSSNLQIEKYNGTDTEVYIPRIVNDRMVVAIVENCFSGNNTLKSVITSSPLWTVGAYAFLNCKSIESFECNFALKEIGGGAFNGASSLKSINLEDSVVTVIRPMTFMSSGIENVILPESCTEIMSYAFAQCPELTKITIPASVTTIHEDAFKSSNNLTIYCYTDSAAHVFAAEHDIPFVLLDGVSYILGDADGSGNVDIVDATFAQRYVTHSDIPAEILSGMDVRADVDSNGEVEATDVTFIMRHLIHIATPHPTGEVVTGTTTGEG